MDTEAYQFHGEGQQRGMISETLTDGMAGRVGGTMGGGGACSQLEAQVYFNYNTQKPWYTLFICTLATAVSCVCNQCGYHYVI